MTVKTITGNLLESDCTAVIHQANCFATMSSGIAKQIKYLYPEVLAADKGFYVPAGNPARLGRYSKADVDGPHGPLTVINLYGQYDYGCGIKTNPEAFETALDRILNDLNRSGQLDLKVGIPYGIGCGLAGGNWKDIRRIIIDLSEKYSIDIYLYKLRQSDKNQTPTPIVTTYHAEDAANIPSRFAKRASTKNTKK